LIDVVLEAAAMMLAAYFLVRVAHVFGRDAAQWSRNRRNAILAAITLVPVVSILLGAPWGRAHAKDCNLNLNWSPVAEDRQLQEAAFTLERQCKSERDKVVWGYALGMALVLGGAVAGGLMNARWGEHAAQEARTTPPKWHTDFDDAV